MDPDVALGAPTSPSPQTAIPPVTASLRTVIHQCQDCGRRFDHGFTPRCPSCTGLVEVLYDLDTVRVLDSNITSQRFADLLPVRDPSNLLFLGEGNTPCVHAARLGEAIGLERLYVKVESTNPTGTTKDRMAAVVLSLFKELGVTDFVSSSTGNSSSALARGIQMNPFCRMHLFVGEAFSSRVRYGENNPGVIVHVMPGMSFTDAFNHARAEAQRRGVPFEGGFFNPARREGLKLAYFEAVEQVPTPIRWYFQAVSSAMGLYGTWKGANELLALKRTSVLPRLVCVQQESCCPMVRAFNDGSSEIKEHHIFHNPTGVAKAILRGNPSGCYPYVYAAVRQSGGTMVSVTEAEIVAARDRLKELDGVDTGYCGAATVAAVTALAGRGDIGREETVLLNLTD
jgi:threonine synthase